jgi:tetratricopeptide (TPR) repeat protein
MITRKLPWLFPVSNHKFIRVYDPSSFSAINIAVNYCTQGKRPMGPSMVPHISVPTEGVSKRPRLSVMIDNAQQYIFVGNLEEADKVLSAVKQEVIVERQRTPEEVKLFELIGMLQQSQNDFSGAVSSFEKSFQLQIQLSGKGPLHHSCWYAYKNLAYAKLCIEKFDSAAHIFSQQNNIFPSTYDLLSRKKIWQEGLTAYALTLIMQGKLDKGVKVLEAELYELAKADRAHLPIELIRYNIMNALEKPILELLPQESLVILGLEDLILDASQSCKLENNPPTKVSFL